MENVQEQIARRAYELFEARGGVDGYHIQDWLQAEKEIASASKKKSATRVDEPAKVKKAAAPKAKTEKAPSAKKVALKK